MKLIRTMLAAALLASATAAPAIDLLVHATTQAQILTALKARGLAQDITDPITSVVTTVPVDNFVWWQESGKVMTAAAVLDGNGNVTAPATYLPGFVLLIRINDPNDVVANPVDGEQTSRSKIAQFIKNNGTPGTLNITGCAPINYYSIGQFKIARFADMKACLTAKGLPGHEFAGGNTP
jgi:hypothetical protein